VYQIWKQNHVEQIFDQHIMM